jgi:hypothetical protein
METLLRSRNALSKSDSAVTTSASMSLQPNAIATDLDTPRAHHNVPEILGLSDASSANTWSAVEPIPNRNDVELDHRKSNYASAPLHSWENLPASSPAHSRLQSGLEVDASVDPTVTTEKEQIEISPQKVTVGALKFHLTRR